MTAHRTVILACDRDGCRETYVGGREQPPSRVRAEAAKLSGWTSHRTTADASVTRADLCRWHS